MIEVDPTQLGSILAVVLVSTIVGVTKSYRSGRLGDVLRAHRGNDVDETLGELVEAVDETCEETKANGDQLDELGEAIVLLHGGEEGVDEKELRQKVGVDELGADIFDDPSFPPSDD